MKIIYTENQKGAVTILVAVVLVGLIGIAAFAIDIGYGLVVKSELQNVADTGSLAGTRELALAYQKSGTYWGETSASTVSSQVLSKVNTMAQKNEAGGMPIAIGTSDIVLGKYNSSTGEVVAAATGALAVKVTARRDGTTNPVIATTLARVLGINSMEIAAHSAASLSAMKSVPAGNNMGIPIGIAKAWFTARNSPCGTDRAWGTDGHAIRLYPAGTQQGETIDTSKSCAGWHTYNDYPATDNKVNALIKSGANPKSTVGDIYNFTNGTLANVVTSFLDTFNKNAVNGVWKTIVPVFEASTCVNPNGPFKIVGYATATVYQVKTGGTKWIDAQVSCNVVDLGEGGNDVDFGTLVGMPGMVQ
jgi:Flp pilus assembly protein TadG